MLEQTINKDAALKQDLELEAALAALRALSTNHDFRHLENDSDLDPERFELDAMPDWSLVEALIKNGQYVRPMAFMQGPATTFDAFCYKAGLLYRHNQPLPILDEILVYAGLTHICAERTYTDDISLASRSYALARTFFTLLTQTLASLPLITPASDENIESLLITSVSMIGFAKPSIARMLTCKAAELCRDLGYHRLPSAEFADTIPNYHNRVMVFWSLYSFDRNISFRYGQVPSIRDEDISTPRLSYRENHPQQMTSLTNFWVDCGRINGRICTELYGPSAQMSPSSRLQLATSLANELEHIHAKRKQVMKNMLIYAHDLSVIIDMATKETISFVPPADQSPKFPDGPWLNADDIMYYATLTTILFSAPSPELGRSCALEAARSCLRLSREMSKEYVHNVYNWTICCHWVLLFAPLTSFTGIFYNIIANPSDAQGDLELLESLASSFEPARRLSDAIDKFYQLCLAFVRVAHAYVAAKKAQQPPTGYTSSSAQKRELSSNQPHPDVGTLLPPGTKGDDFSSAFSQDDLLPDFLSTAQGLQDWHTGNAALYSLLEEDLMTFEMNLPSEATQGL